jgi:hypothetical protein
MWVFSIAILALLLVLVPFGCYSEFLREEEAYLYDFVDNHVFSPDGQRFAYRAQQGNEWMIIVDGVAGIKYDFVDQPHFSPDTECYAYRAKQNGKWLLVVNETEGNHYDFVDHPQFAPNSDYSIDNICLVHRAKLNGKWEIIPIHESQHGDAEKLE